jgi:hypothetical protein
MTQSSTYKSYLKSLLWLALSAALAAGAANITQLVIIDFIHGNPNRPISNAITMMWLFTFIFGIIAIFGIFMVFSISQFTQATVARISEGLRYQSSIVIASIPFVSIVTWYCWEYLTPTDFNLGINEGADWQPYQHGITFWRYAYTLCWQTPVTVFSLLYVKTPIGFLSRKRLIGVLFFMSCALGISVGYVGAESQIRQFM